MSEEKKYTRKELYLGYYWLILHTDPFHDPNGGFRDGGLIVSSGYWETEMPDCVKTAIGEHVTLLAKINKELRLTPPLWQRIELPFEPNAEAQMASLQRIKSLVSAIFNWFINKNIPLLRVDNKEIMCWRDLRRLWKKATVIDSSGKSFFLTQLEGFKEYKLGEWFYDRYHDDILYALKSYLEPQHKKNLEMLETPAGKKGAETPAPQPRLPGKASFSTLVLIVFLGSLLYIIYPKFVFVLTWFDIVLTWTDILIVITPLVLILGFLASIATLIMFVYWLRPLQK